MWLMFVLEKKYKKDGYIANGTCVSFCNQPKAHIGLPRVLVWVVLRGKTVVQQYGVKTLNGNRNMNWGTVV